MNKILKVIFLFFGILFICVVIAEMALKIIGYSYSPLKLSGPEEFVKGLGKTDWRLHHISYDKYCVYDHQLIWRPRKGYRIFNAQGFRGAELNSLKRPGEYRIFVIGDSNSAGPYNSPGWPEYLGQLFRRDTPSVTVTNAACWGIPHIRG